jgi:hypothetical protein
MSSVTYPGPDGTIIIEVEKDEGVVTSYEPGPSGPSGAASSTYEHVQATPATVWTINHPLGYDPLVVQVLVDGEPAIAEFVYSIPDTQVRITFENALAGMARLR